MKQVDCLLSTTYAKDWIESFPKGNGHIGVMDSGNPHTSIITLNDDTLWSGYGANNDKQVSPEIWTDIRSALNKNDFSRAEQLIHDNVLSAWVDSYLPLGTITIDRPLGLGSVNNYKRILDMSRGVGEISFSVDNKAYKRTSFVSAVHDVYIASITSSMKDSTTIMMTSPLASNVTLDIDAMTIAISGTAPSYVAPIYQNSKSPVIYDTTKDTINYYALLKIITDGKVSTVDNGFAIDEYTSIQLIYSSNTSFRIKNNLEQHVKSVVNKAEKVSYDRLVNSHVLDFAKLYNRCNITLDYKSPDQVIATADLMKKFEQDDSYLEAVVNLFNLGRYLMISSSRKGTMPSNLQGIWNKDIRAPWSSNYTLNINTEMNYWGAEIVNLSELHEPLIEFIKRLARNGTRTAKLTYGLDGFTVAHNSDIWAHTNPVGGEASGALSTVYGFNISTAGWLAMHLFMHYEFTGDIQFLAETAYPIMKEAAKFYLGYLTTDSETGYLVPSPSASPENYFVSKFKFHAINKASTMDVSVIRTLFREILISADVLSIKDDFVTRVSEALPALYPYKIGKKGQLLEWYDDYKETDKHHRHISHMYGLFPSNDIAVTGNPELIEACKTSLKRRGTAGTGWSMAWKINAYARLGDGETAFDLIKRQLNMVPASQGIGLHKGGSYNNMLCAHPPFQIDGNFGAMSGIAEMLIQSHQNCIELLPALPKSWKNGSFRGLCARGGYIVNLTWKNGKVSEFEILSNYKTEVGVKIDGALSIYKTNKLIRP